MGDDGGRGGAAVAGFVFHAVPLIGIVAGGDLDAAAAPRSFTRSESAGVGAASAASQTGMPAAETVSAAARAKTLGAEAGVVADEEAGAGFFRADCVTGDRPGHLADVFEGEILGDDGAPAVGAERDFVHGESIRDEFCGGKVGRV